jgi:hypothetical protein
MLPNSMRSRKVKSSDGQSFNGEEDFGLRNGLKKEVSHEQIYAAVRKNSSPLQQEFERGLPENRPTPGSYSWITAGRKSIAF